MLKLTLPSSTISIVSLFWCLLFHFASCLTLENNGSVDYAALMAIKSKLILEPDNILSTNWTSNTHYCTWFGVSCFNHRVTHIVLSGLKLHGELSPKFANLSHLEELDLRRNELGGILPSEFGSLQRLRVLILANNSLLGSIPANLSRCRKLEILNLADNSIAGSIPEELAYLANLRGLYLYNNNLTGNIPASFGNLSKLEILSLDSNRITGKMPNEFSRLLKLQTLYVNENRISGGIPHVIFNITSLLDLDVRQNYLSGNLPPDFGKGLPNLEWFSLSHNQLSGELPPSICNATKLIILEVINNSFSGPIPMMLGNLVHLESLQLGLNSFTNNHASTQLEFLTSLVNCPNLQYLDFPDNPLNGEIPESIGNMTINLESFSAGYFGLKGLIPQGFGNLSGLNSLILETNNLQGSIPSSFASLRNLQGIDLSKNRLEGSIPTVLCGIHIMVYLDLSRNKFSGSIPTCFQNLTQLNQISLGANKLNSTVPLDFWRLENVQELYLHENLLHGNIPAEVGNMKSITILDLSSNMFSSEIPSTIGTLIVIQSLDLSSNNISGEIPSSIGSLRDLHYLNLSFNRLQGEIPHSGVFANISFQSLMGNPNLCGTPKLNFSVCSSPQASRQKRRSRGFVLKITVPIVATSLLLFAMVLLLIKLSRGHPKKAKATRAEVSLVEHQMISRHELVHATNSFSPTNLLGEGSSGMVYKAVLSDETIAAVKVFNMQYVKALRNFDAECEILRNVRHRNLVKIISTCTNPEFKAMILEFMSNGSLDLWLHSQTRSLSLVERLDIMTDVALGMEYLHHEYEVPIVHCDLKPANVLLNEDMVAHVADFGISKILAQDQEFVQTNTLGTIGYMAPEYGLDGHASTKGDVYSFGILLLETFTGKRPTDDMFKEGSSLYQWVYQVFPDSLVEVLDSHLFADIISSGEGSSGPINRNPQPTEGVLVSIIQLALLCLKESPEERIDMKTAAAHLKKIRAQLKKPRNNARR